MNKWFFLKRKKPIIPLYSNNYNLRQKSQLSTIQHTALENGQTEHFFSPHSCNRQAVSESLPCLLAFKFFKFIF